MSRNSDPGASVSARIFSILDCFEGAADGLSLTEIAGRTQLPVSTARRILADLQQWGGVDRGEDGLYRVGLRLWRVGAAHSASRSLRNAAMPFLHGLYAATKETVHLVVPDDDGVICIEALNGPASHLNRSVVGATLPLHASAVGKVLLAYRPDLLAELPEHGLKRFTSATVTDRAALNRRLVFARRTRIGCAHEELTEGVWGAAAAIWTGGRAEAAVGVVVGSESAMNRMKPAVLAAALGISQAIGPDHTRGTGVTIPRYEPRTGSR